MTRLSRSVGATRGTRAPRATSAVTNAPRSAACWATAATSRDLPMPGEPTTSRAWARRVAARSSAPSNQPQLLVPADARRPGGAQSTRAARPAAARRAEERRFGGEHRPLGPRAVRPRVTAPSPSASRSVACRNTASASARRPSAEQHGHQLGPEPLPVPVPPGQRPQFVDQSVRRRPARRAPVRRPLWTRSRPAAAPPAGSPRPGRSRGSPKSAYAWPRHSASAGRQPGQRQCRLPDRSARRPSARQRSNARMSALDGWMSRM